MDKVLFIKKKEPTSICNIYLLPPSVFSVIISPACASLLDVVVRVALYSKTSPKIVPGRMKFPSGKVNDRSIASINKVFPTPLFPLRTINF
jgi:hypothetical protein